MFDGRFVYADWPDALASYEAGVKAFGEGVSFAACGAGSVRAWQAGWLDAQARMVAQVAINLADRRKREQGAKIIRAASLEQVANGVSIFNGER